MKYLYLGFMLVVLSLEVKATEVSLAEIEHLHLEAKQAFFATDYTTAITKWQSALEYARTLDKKADISKFLVNLGVVNYTLGQYPKALEYYQQAVIIDRELGDKSGESADLTNVGLIHYYLGQYPLALQAYQQALPIQIKLNNKSGYSDNLGNVGMVYDSLGQYQKAIDYYQQALEIKQELDDSFGIANNLSNLGGTYKNLSNYPQALTHFQQAIEIQEKIGDQNGIANNLTNLGTVYDSLGEYPKALKHYQQALQIQNNIEDLRGIASSLSNLGVVHDNLGEYPNALRYYQQALQIQRALGEQREIGNTLANIGITYKNKGNLPKALAHYQQAIEIQTNIGDARGEANTLTYLGVVYDSFGQYPKALEHYLQALDIQRQLGDKQRIANNLSNLGVLYYNLGQSEKAIGYFLQALTIKREIGDKRGEAIDLSNLGAAYESQQLRKKAVKSYQQALEIRRQIEDKRGESTDLSNLGAVYANMKKYQDALTHLKLAFLIDRELGDRMGEATDLSNIGLLHQQLGKLEKARTALQDSVRQLETLGSNHLWYAQRGLAAVEVQLNETETAMIHYEQALTNLEKLRAGLEKADKLSFMQNKLYVYDELITLLQHLHQEQPNKGYDRKALEIFERKQGRVLLEEIGKMGAQRFARLPDSITEQEQALTHQLSQIQAKLVQARHKPFMEQDRTQIKTLTQRLHFLTASFQALQTEIQQKYPDYHALKYPQPATVAQLQNDVLQTGEAILVYAVMAKSTALWIISPHQFAMFTLPAGEEELQESVAYMRDVILNRLPEIVEEGLPLYQTLFPKSARSLLAKAHTLYIVPTGPLYALPFETLVTQATNYYKPHYLIEDYAIIYLSSASLLKVLRDTQKQRHTQPSKKLLAFADSVYEPCLDNNSGTIARARTVAQLRTNAYRAAIGAICFPRLPETASEAKVIAQLFKAPKSDLHLGEQANKTTVFNLNDSGQLSNYRYLLFATHGLLPYEVQGLTQSALVLSYPQTQGYLTMADAFTLQLNADFINLSACNTGRGQKFKGEGIMGLTRAFLYAGTSAISVTLWAVESASAEKLSIGIFSNLNQGKNPAEALRQIKLKMIAGKAAQPYYKQPFYWAPFVVYGNGG